MPIGADDFVALLNGGRETRAVEFKQGGARNDPLGFAFVASAVIALSNLYIGGWAILGGADDGTLSGLSASHAATWLEYDEVSAGLNAYADPFVQVDVEQVTYDGKTFIVLRVQEFAEVPTIARKDSPAKHAGKLVIRRGGC